MKDRLWIVVLAVVVPAALVYPHLPGDAGATLYGVVLLFTIPTVLVSVRGRGLRPTGPWGLIGAGLLMFVTGDALLAAYGWTVDTAPFPWFSDIFYLGSYPLLIVGLGRMARMRAGAGERETVIDAAIVTVGAGMLVWVYFIAPAAADTSLTSLARAVAGAYPVMDLLLVAMVARLLFTSGRLTPAFVLLALSYGALLASDVVYQVTQLVELPLLPTLRLTVYCLTYAFGPAALAHPSAVDVIVARSDGAALTRRRLALLAGAALLAPGLLAFQTVTDRQVSGVAIAAGSAILFLLVIARMSGLVAELQKRTAQVEALARRDPLTGVLNRRGWDERLPQELARARRTGEAVAIALLDLDHFKAFNDRFGHQAGDDLLRTIAAAWMSRLRAQDVIARYGGEEFGVILPGCDAAEAGAIVDRLRLAVPSPQTCSAGVAVYDGSLGPAPLVKRADDALYRAKDAGRDRTVVADSPMPAEPRPDLVT